MRIALVGPTYPYRGGVALYTTLMCKALRESHDVRFVSFSRQYPKFLFPGRTDRDGCESAVRVEGVSYLIDSINPRTWRASVVELARYKPDMLVIPWWVTFWAPHFAYIAKTLKRATGCEVVVVCHNVVEHEANCLKRLLSKWVLSLADRIVTHSQEETERARALLGAKAKVTTGYLPTYSPTAPAVEDKAEARRELGISGPVLLFFGFVRKYKGLHTLIEALPRVLRETNATLLVVGEFWDDKRYYLEEMSRLGISDHVVIVDRYVPDSELATYFLAADLVVQPYLSASGSAVCQLAYGFGRPVVATRVGSLPEVVRDGENGRLVAPGAPDDLAAAIIESLAPGPLVKLNKAASETPSRFGWERMARIVAGEAPFSQPEGGA